MELFVTALFIFLMATRIFSQSSNTTRAIPSSISNTNQSISSTSSNTIHSIIISPSAIVRSNESITSCQINLANNMTTSLLRHYFRTNTSSGTVFMVYFRLKYTDVNESVNDFNISLGDTFEPDLWVWAAGKGKNLLRLPIDNKILSLGLLAIQASNVEINFDSTTYSCLESLPPDVAIQSIGKYITENVTFNETSLNVDTQGPIVCRSVYAFEHYLYGKKGIGFDCCAPSGDTETKYICDQSYSDAYELVWYGPIVLMCFIYLIGIVHFYKLYKKSFRKVQLRRLVGLHKTLQEIKTDVFNRIVLNTERWARIQTPEALIALRERCGLLDVMGIGKKSQSNIVFCQRIIFGICLLISYYGIWGAFLKVYYDQLGDTIKKLNDSQTVYLNIVGHIGWIFCRKELGIYYYSVFECVFTAIVPIFALYSYASIWFKKKINKAESDPTAAGELKSLLMYQFFTSRFGVVLQYITLFLAFVHFVFLGGVFLSYLIYMVGLGLFASIDVVFPWLIPMTLFLHFFSTVFDPAYDYYNTVKELLFSICFENFQSLIIKQNRELFLPRDIIENFYVPNSRSLLYTIFLKIFWVLVFIFLLLLVILTLQYPYNTKLTSIVQFLGVQAVFVLPYLAKIMYVNNQISPLESTIMKKDLQGYLENYINDRPELKDAHKKEDLSANDQKMYVNYNRGVRQRGELGFDTNVLATAASEALKKIKF